MGNKREMNSLTFSQKMKLNDLLREHLEDAGEGFCRYKDPAMDDEAITKLLPFKSTKHNVAGLRLEVYGKLSTGTRVGINAGSNNSIRITELERKMDIIAAQLGIEF